MQKKLTNIFFERLSSFLFERNRPTEFFLKIEVRHQQRFQQQKNLKHGQFLPEDLGEEPRGIPE